MENAGGVARRGSSRRRIAFMAVAALAVAAVSVTAVWWFTSVPNSGLQGTPATLSYSTFFSENTPPYGVTVVNTTNSIYVNQTGVTVMVESTPPWLNRSGDFFVCYGLVNPSFHIRQGVQVRFQLINADNDQHDLLISRQAPPYPYSPMMGMGMMWQNHNWMYGSVMLGGFSGTIGPGSQIPMLYLNAGFKVAGTYWYLCGYPGHAQEGMYGQMIVQ